MGLMSRVRGRVRVRVTVRVRVRVRVRFSSTTVIRHMSVMHTPLPSVHYGPACL